MSAEKHFARLDAKHILECRKFRKPKDWRVESRNSKPLTLNEGLLFESAKQYAIGDLLKLKLVIPLMSSNNEEMNFPVTLIGSVVRVEMVRDGNYEIGVCFTRLDQRYRSRLLDFLAGRK